VLIPLCAILLYVGATHEIIPLPPARAVLGVFVRSVPVLAVVV
jgi:hypothetical protein